MNEIYAVITALGHLTNVAKTITQTHSQVIKQSVQIEFNEALIDLHGKITGLQASYQTIWESNEALKKEIASFDKWTQESARYTLIPVSKTGACVYALKEPHPGEVLHWLCPTCFEDRRKSILQPDNLNHYSCPKCNTEVIATRAFQKVDDAQPQIERLSTEAEQVLLRYASAERGISLPEATQGMSLSTQKADYVFDQLLKRRFIRLTGGRAGGPITHSATPDGREYLNKTGLLK